MVFTPGVATKLPHTGNPLHHGGGRLVAGENCLFPESKLQRYRFSPHRPNQLNKLQAAKQGITGQPENDARTANGVTYPKARQNGANRTVSHIFIPNMNRSEDRLNFMSGTMLY